MIEHRHRGSGLIRALRDLDLPEANRLIDLPGYVSMLDDDVSPLMVAAYRGLAAECQRLIDLGADVLHNTGVHYGEGSDEFQSVEIRADMSQDTATKEVIGRAAAKARCRLVLGGDKSCDPWQTLEDCALYGLVGCCASLMDGHVSMLNGGASAEKVLVAAYRSRDWRTFHVVMAMSAVEHEYLLGELVGPDFIEAVKSARAFVENAWIENDLREARQGARRAKA